MIRVRKAEEADVPQIRAIFEAVYQRGYPYHQFYDELWLRRSIHSDDMLMLIAEESEGNRILGTASVVFDIGAYSDLVGEFGRLAVHPEARCRGIGKLLMQKRIEAIQDRLHVGQIDARVVHDYAQRISLAHQFVPVGFMPLKHYFYGRRESLVVLVRYFGDALALRKNHPRIIPEVYPLADNALRNLSLPGDVIVDEETPPYPHDQGYVLKELTAEGLPALLRIERGRVRKREVFGHMRLEYGFFKLRLGHARYMLACQNEHISGAVGFTLDTVDRIVRVFELITATDDAVRFLLSELERRSREEWDINYIEIDVSAHATMMQRTLLELHFLPAAYIPAMVFHLVERLDIVRMVRLINMEDLGPMELVPSVDAVKELVMRGFASRSVAPRIAQAVSDAPLFLGLSPEQRVRLASACLFRHFPSGETIFRQDEAAERMYLLLSGEVGIRLGTPPVEVGRLGRGELLGELSMLTSGKHSATCVAEVPVDAAMLTHRDLSELIRLRPDIGVILYKNLAAGLGKKLVRFGLSLRERIGDLPAASGSEPQI